MSCQIYEQPTESGLPMFHTSYMASSAMMSAEIKGGMKKMVMFRHLDMNTNMVNQRIEALGFINPFNSKSFHFEKDTVSIAEVKFSIDNRYISILHFSNADTVEFCHWSGHYKKRTQYQLVQRKVNCDKYLPDEFKINCQS